MAKYSIYAVGRGIDPDTKQEVSGLKVHTWEECEKYVKGVEGAKFKGFLTDYEADAWLDKIANDNRNKGVQIDTSGSMQQPHVPHIDLNMNQDAAKSDFVDICMSMGVNPNNMLSKLIINFVDTYRFVHPKEEEKFDLDEPLPFN